MLLGGPKSQPPCTGRGCCLSVPYRLRKKTWCTWQRGWTTTNVTRYQRKHGETLAPAAKACFDTGVGGTARSCFGGAIPGALPVAPRLGVGPLRGDRAWHRRTAPQRGDCPATPCMLLWGVFRMCAHCSCDTGGERTLVGVGIT